VKANKLFESQRQINNFLNQREKGHFKGLHIRINGFLGRNLSTQVHFEYVENPKDSRTTITIRTDK
jgi:hypothetical protein